MQALRRGGGDPAASGSPPNVPTMESGTATLGITVAERFRRNKKMTITTSTTVSISSNNGNIVVNFTGVLQSAPSVTGPWTDMTGVTSPYTAPATQDQQYFRSHP